MEIDGRGGDQEAPTRYLLTRVRNQHCLWHINVPRQHAYLGISFYTRLHAFVRKWRIQSCLFHSIPEPPASKETACRVTALALVD